MPVFEKHTAGTFCWIENGTTDQHAARAFYTSLFGWTAVDNPMGPDAFYTIYLREGRTVASAYKLSQMEQHGQIIPPFDVQTFGRMAVIQDPAGAIFCVWQAKTHIGVSVRDEFGSLCWADLNTSDPAKAAAFYSGLFGWITEASPDVWLLRTIPRTG
jgi:predicted enzyme related to lactoylglutathione lyase